MRIGKFSLRDLRTDWKGKKPTATMSLGQCEKMGLLERRVLFS
jgi:DNA-binding MarR family transcriptional regulator